MRCATFSRIPWSTDSTTGALRLFKQSSHQQSLAHSQKCSKNETGPIWSTMSARTPSHSHLVILGFMNDHRLSGHLAFRFAEIQLHLWSILLLQSLPLIQGHLHDNVGDTFSLFCYPATFKQRLCAGKMVNDLVEGCSTLQFQWLTRPVID